MIESNIKRFAQDTKIGYQELMEAIRCFSPCMNDYLYVYDIDADKYSISDSAMDRFNVPGTVFTDVVESHRQFVYDEDFDMLQKDLGQMIDGTKVSHNLKYRWIGKDGNPIWINCRGIVIRGEHTLMVGCINEIGEKMYADNVTGLLRDDALRSVLREISGAPSGFMLRIGIDGFKQLNERLGNHYGDKCLKDVANCIKECLYENQYVFRMISDEMLVLDSNSGTEEDAKELYQSIKKKISSLQSQDNYQAIYTISAGIITDESIDIPISQLSYDWINNRSLFALNRAKELGRNQVYAFRQQDYERFIRNGEILSSVRKSVANSCKGFSLNYQPIMLNGDNATIFAAESLLRYERENGEKVSPVELIPILEESGLIIPVGNWIFDEAFRMCKKCQETVPQFKITVNLSYVQLRKSDLYYNIMKALKKNDLSADSVVIELTESGNLEYASVMDVWQRLRREGFFIAIDDFGTGYSNLHNIVELHPNIVKIDRSFTMKALHNDYEGQLMKYIITMVHSIDVSLVVEGIESQTELDKINGFEPDYIQGYYYSKPITEEEFFAKFS